MLATSSTEAETYKGYEMLPYEVLRTDEATGIEFRRIKPHIAAEVTVDGDRKSAGNKAFRILAGYIFGKNSTQNQNAPEKVAMTTPVTMTQPEKISMTTPVTQSATENGTWVMRFSMPASYTLETLPKPENADIRFISEKEQKIAALIFDGFSTKHNLSQNTETLRQHLQAQKLPFDGNPVYAFYDDPFTLPWNRRNEVWFFLK